MMSCHVDALQIVNYRAYPTYENLMVNKFKKLKLIIFAAKRLAALLGFAKTNAPLLPEELVVRILVHLDSADLEKVISCCNGDISLPGW